MSYNVLKRLSAVTYLSMVFIGFLLVFVACRKNDRKSELGVSNSQSLEARFFTSHRSGDEKERRIVEFISRVNRERPFIDTAVERIGYPFWDKMMVFQPRISSAMVRVAGVGSNSKGSASGNYDLYYVPFVREDQNYINASLVIKATPTDTTFTYLCDWEYRQVKNDINRMDDPAENLAVFFMQLDRRVFGHKKFLVTDKMLFRSDNHSVRGIELVDDNTQGNKSNNMVEYCRTIRYSYIQCPYMTNPAYNFTCPNGPPGQCDGCWQYCTAWNSVDYCWSEYYYPDSGGGGGGGGTGGSGGGGAPPPNPCDPTEPGGGGGGHIPEAVKPKTGTNPAIKVNNVRCDPGWTPEDDQPTEAQIYYNQYLTPTEGQDGDPYDAGYWDDPNLTMPAQTLPTWAIFSAAYPKHSDPLYDTPLEMYTNVGGDVLAMYNSNPATFQNTCALRISKALNYAGITIPAGPGRFQGADGKYYFLGASTLFKWLKLTFGTPQGNHHITGAQGGPGGINFPGLVSGMKGIYVMLPVNQGQGSNGFGASGHADIINNGLCDGGCFFNAKGGVQEIFIWELL